MLARKRKIICVVGLSHSGSTVLDMLLTTRGKAVGLGQVWTVLREDPERKSNAAMLLRRLRSRMQTLGACP